MRTKSDKPGDPVKKTVATYDVQCYNWVLANPILFDKPILNVKGALSFWDYPNIHSELDNGKQVCMCSLGIEEKDQVINYISEFRCKYCGGIWYK